MELVIKKAEQKDWKKIVNFQLEMALETEKLKLDKKMVETGVKSVFSNPSLGQYYVACDAGEVIASTLITFEWSDWRAKTVWWIQSVYVVPQLRGKKVFKTMYQYLKEIVSKDDSLTGLRLYVDKTNTNAQKVYENLGMNGEHYHLFEWMK